MERFPPTQHLDTAAGAVKEKAKGGDSLARKGGACKGWEPLFWRWVGKVRRVAEAMRLF